MNPVGFFTGPFNSASFPILLSLPKRHMWAWATIALSSAEAEPYATAKASAELIGMISIYRDFGKATAAPLHKLSLEEAHKLSLPDGSMGPKLAAAAGFAESGGISGIGRLEDALAILAGKAGTAVSA